MRIGKGIHRGKRIFVPQGIRPTQDLVKKALFDILGDIKGTNFLDLFAGSGRVGIEAISSGAEEVIFVDKDKECTKNIKKNLSLLGINEGFRVICSDFFLAIKRLFREGKKFDFIFLDPPYEKGLAKKTLKILSLYDIVKNSGLVIVQHSPKENLPERAGELFLFKKNLYGQTALTFYYKNVQEGNLSRNI